MKGMFMTVLLIQILVAVRIEIVYKASMWALRVTDELTGEAIRRSKTMQQLSLALQHMEVYENDKKSWWLFVSDLTKWRYRDFYPSVWRQLQEET